MKVTPVRRMWIRTQLAKEHSDSDFFRNLTLAGEFMTKLVAIGLVASLEDDRERSGLPAAFWRQGNCGYLYRGLRRFPQAAAPD